MNDRLLLVFSAMLAAVALLPQTSAAPLALGFLIALVVRQRWSTARSAVPLLAILLPIGTAGLYGLAGIPAALAFAAISSVLAVSEPIGPGTRRRRNLLLLAAILLLGATVVSRWLLPELPPGLPVLVLLLLDFAARRLDERWLERLRLTAHPVRRMPPAKL